MDALQINTRIDLARLYAYQGRWFRVFALLNEEVETDVDFGARAITRARMDLWCTSSDLWIDQGYRNPQREGDLFSELSTLFEEVKRTQTFTLEQQKVLNQKRESMPQGSRIRILYSCLLYTSPSPRD